MCRIRKLRPRVPVRGTAECDTSLDRLLLAFGNHAKEAPVANDSHHPWHGLDFGLIKALEPCAIARRAHYPPVQHAGQPDVLHERDAPRDLGRNVEALDGLAHELMLTYRLRRHLSGRLSLEIGLAGKLPVAH